MDETEYSLQPQVMLELYAKGAFPMAPSKDSDEVHWFLPKEKRCVIPLPNYNVPRSLKQFMNKTEYEVRFDFNYSNAIKHCGMREDTWISPRLIDAYDRLFLLGFLHSVEIYLADELMGGLYGVAINGAFFGESMFTVKPQGSKIAMIELIKHLNAKNFKLLDVQYQTEHLALFGAEEISYSKYKRILSSALNTPTSFANF